MSKLYNTLIGMIANNSIMLLCYQVGRCKGNRANNSIMLLCYQVGRCKGNRKSLVEIPPTHPCIAMKKLLKDLAFEKRKYKLCKSSEKSTIYI